MLPADIATVNPDRKRTIGSGKFVPDAFNETELFVTQFPLQALRYIRNVLANGERIDGLTAAALNLDASSQFDGAVDR